MSLSSLLVRPGLNSAVAFLGSFLLCLLSAPTTGSAQGLTFTLSPSARWIEWDEDLAFRQTRLWGG